MVSGKQMVILEREGADGSGGEEAAWGEEQSQLGHSRMGESLEHNSPRWVSSVTHLAPNVTSDRDIRKKDVGDCKFLHDGPWMLNMNFKHLGIPGEERKLSYQGKNIRTLLYSNPKLQVKVSTACLTLGK